MLVDSSGKILSAKEQEYAELKLKEFMETNKKLFEEWLQQNGPVRFPIHFDTDKREWFWTRKKQEKKLF
jgi:hypothetical protein